jgi:hypothetical protein
MPGEAGGDSETRAVQTLLANQILPLAPSMRDALQLARMVGVRSEILPVAGEPMPSGAPPRVNQAAMGTMQAKT